MGFFDKLLGRRNDSNKNINAVFDKIYKFMTDEKTQNLSCMTALRELMEAGGAVNEVNGASGDFGRCLTNPIPVNGSIGELVYISNLVLPNGIHLIGHRLGSVDQIDIYETVSLDGTKWDLLFFDFYHTRKSLKFPSGYKRCSEPEKFLHATNVVIPKFPIGIYEAMRECSSKLVGVPIVSSALRDESRLHKFTRPELHQNIVSKYNPYSILDNCQ